MPATDTLYVDDAATLLDRIGVVTSSTISGLGMTHGAPTPNFVQVVTVLGAVNGRFTLTVAGYATTDQLAFDATAAQVQAALAARVGAGNVIVTKAGGRWTVAWTGALAGLPGWSRTIEIAAVAGHPLVAASGSVTTGVLKMTDGRIDYAAFESLDLTLGSGSDVLNVDSTHTGSTVVHAADGNDRVFVEAVSGETTIQGQNGDDWLLVNAVPNPVGVQPDGRPDAQPRRRRELGLLHRRAVRRGQQPHQHARRDRRRHQRAHRERLRGERHLPLPQQRQRGA